MPQLVMMQREPTVVLVQHPQMMPPMAQSVTTRPHRTATTQPQPEPAATQAQPTAQTQPVTQHVTTAQPTADPPPELAQSTATTQPQPQPEPTATQAQPTALQVRPTAPYVIQLTRSKILPLLRTPQTPVTLEPSIAMMSYRTPVKTMLLRVILQLRAIVTTSQLPEPTV